MSVRTAWQKSETSKTWLSPFFPPNCVLKILWNWQTVFTRSVTLQKMRLTQILQLRECMKQSEVKNTLIIPLYQEKCSKPLSTLLTLFKWQHFTACQSRWGIMSGSHYQLIFSAGSRLIELLNPHSEPLIYQKPSNVEVCYEDTKEEGRYVEEKKKQSNNLRNDNRD